MNNGRVQDADFEGNERAMTLTQSEAMTPARERPAPMARVPQAAPLAVPMTSDGTDVLFRELAAAQMDFGEVKKTRTAEVKNRSGVFLYSYQYANLADVTAAVMPALKAHGIVPIQIPRPGCIVVRLVHGASNQWIEGSLPFVAPGQGPDGIQALGSAITYMRRYLLTMMLGIVAVEGDDDDGATAQHESRGYISRGADHDAPPPSPPKPSGRDDAIRALVQAAKDADTLAKADAAVAALAGTPSRARAEGWFALARVAPVDLLPAVRERAVKDMGGNALFTRDLDDILETRRDPGERDEEELHRLGPPPEGAAA